jgi:hypothetical protein
VLTDAAQRAAYDEALTTRAAPDSASSKDDAVVAPASAPSPSRLDLVPEKARRHLEPQLRDGEEVMAIINGLSSQAIVAFRTRLFVVKPGFMAGAAFGARVTSFDYRNITAIELNKKMTTAVIEVIAAGYQGVNATSVWSSKEGRDPYKLSNCLPLMRETADQAEPVLADIRELITELHHPTASPANGKSVGIADELAKLAELRQQGVLSDEEFEGAKTRLLHS